MILYRVIGLNFEFRGQVEIEDEVKLSAPVIFHNCSDAFSDYVREPVKNVLVDFFR